MRRAAATFLAFLALSGCTREEARARLQGDIHADTIDIIHARFPCHSPAICTFSATGFASLKRGSTVTAIFAGTCRRDNGVGASCRGRVCRASTRATSVCAKRAAIDFKWGRAGSRGDSDCLVRARHDLSSHWMN
jgi:hypothetical protein